MIKKYRLSGNNRKRTRGRKLQYVHGVRKINHIKTKFQY